MEGGICLRLICDGPSTLADSVVEGIGKDRMTVSRIELDDLEPIDAADEVAECALIVTEATDRELTGRIEEVAAIDPLRPIVVIDAVPSVERASSVARVGIADYLPATDLQARNLQERIERSVERGQQLIEHRSESRYFTALLEGVPYSLYVKDGTARNIAVSDHLAESIGMDPIGKTDLEIWSAESGDSGERSYADDLEVIDRGTPVIDRLERHQPAEGEELWLLTTKLPWHDREGRIKGVIGITMDITEHQVEKRELRESAERFEQFSSIVSHDLKKPHQRRRRLSRSCPRNRRRGRPRSGG